MYFFHPLEKIINGIKTIISSKKSKVIEMMESRNPDAQNHMNAIERPVTFIGRQNFRQKTTITTMVVFRRTFVQVVLVAGPPLLKQTIIKSHNLYCKQSQNLPKQITDTTLTEVNEEFIG